jgi:hypothetical protein
MAEIELCKQFCKLVMADLPSSIEKECSIFSIHTKKDVNDLLNELINFTRLDNKTIYILNEIVNRTPDFTLPSQYVYSHVAKGTSFWRDSSYEPKVISSSLIKKPDYQDIHVLRGEDR